MLSQIEHIFKTLNVLGKLFKSNKLERNIEWESRANSVYFLMHDLFFFSQL